MNPALQRFRGSFRHSMKSFAPGLTFHAQVGATILHYMYILTKMLFNITMSFHLHYSWVIHMMIKVNVDVISERFWLVPACEPSALLTAFLERFKSACLLAQQLPAMKPEQLKSMVRQEKSLSLSGYRQKCPLKHSEHCRYIKKT